jgi:hypothetical protein
VFNLLAILDVELPHFLEFARVSAVFSDELSGDSNWLCAVTCVFGTRTEEFCVSKTVGLNVATILVTDAIESLALGIVTTILAMAASLSFHFARVHGESSAVPVRLPDVNFRAAGSVVAKACIVIGVAGLPVFDVGLTLD